MVASSFGKWSRLGAGALALLLGMALACQGQDRCACSGPRCLEDLERLGPCQLADLFARADVGRPLVGTARGRLLTLTDRFMPKAKLGVSALVWRGKAACEDGRFVNRWIGGRQAIGSYYQIGSSWFDGRPAVIMEYPPGTRLFENMHDELREIAPGLYLGPVYERFPCPKFRGWVALQLECCPGGAAARGIPAECTEHPMVSPNAQQAMPEQGQASGAVQPAQVGLYRGPTMSPYAPHAGAGALLP